MMHDIFTTKVESQELAIFFLGQNSFIIKNPQGTLIAIDPYFSRHPQASYVHKTPPLQPEDCKVDFIFCTHDHLDHTDPTTLKGIAAASPKTIFYGPPASCKRMLKIGIDSSRLHTLHPKTTVKIADFQVTTFTSILGTEKKPSWNPREEAWTEHYGYLFDFHFAKVYNMGDSSPEATAQPTQILKEIAQFNVDIAMFPIIGDIPTRRPKDAFTFAHIVKPQIVIPTHYDCFQNIMPGWPRTVDPQTFVDLFKVNSEIKPIVISYQDKYIYTTD